MSDSALFSPISDVPISGSVRYRWSRISDWVTDIGLSAHLWPRHILNELTAGSGWRQSKKTLLSTKSNTWNRLLYYLPHHVNVFRYCIFFRNINHCNIKIARIYPLSKLWRIRKFCPEPCKLSECWIIQTGFVSSYKLTSWLYVYKLNSWMSESISWQS